MRLFLNLGCWSPLFGTRSIDNLLSRVMLNTKISENLDKTSKMCPFEHRSPPHDLGTRRSSVLVHHAKERCCTASFDYYNGRMPHKVCAMILYYGHTARHTGTHDAKIYKGHEVLGSTHHTAFLARSRPDHPMFCCAMSSTLTAKSVLLPRQDALRSTCNYASLQDRGIC